MITIRLKDDLYSLIKTAADKEGRSATNYLDWRLRKLFDKVDTNEDYVETWNKLAKVNGAPELKLAKTTNRDKVRELIDKGVVKSASSVPSKCPVHGIYSCYHEVQA